MIINKFNQNIIGTNNLSLNDLFISSFNFLIHEKRLVVKISDEKNEDKHTIIFEKLFELRFSSINGYTQYFNEEVYEWEMIPNNFVNDNFIEETKNLYLANGRKWNEDLFAVRFLMSNMDEIKIICECIRFNE
jgi:hypothetical protein